MTNETNTPSTYERSVAMHLDTCAADIRGRTYRLYEALDQVGVAFTWDELMIAIERATGLRVTLPTLRQWKKRHEASEESAA